MIIGMLSDLAVVLIRITKITNALLISKVHVKRLTSPRATPWSSVEDKAEDFSIFPVTRKPDKIIHSDSRTRQVACVEDFRVHRL